MSATEPPHFEMPKELWGDGPWQTEPDRLEWRDAFSGLPCLIVRNAVGALCGYVGVPPGHPWHGKNYDDVDAQAHGGLTYSAACDGPICHVPAPGEPADVWWLGFDCAHFMDLVPVSVANRRSRPISFQMAAVERQWSKEAAQLGVQDTYRDIEYVKVECAYLALQAAVAAGKQQP